MVLVADRDVQHIGSLVEILGRDGFRVTYALSADEALGIITKAQPDLLIVDLLEEGGGAEGFDLCRRTRLRSTVPIIVLTHHDDEATRIRGFEVGADDFISKDCGERELVARARAVLRRSEQLRERAPGVVLRDADLALNPESHEVWIRDERLVLPRKEFEVLKMLLLHKGKLVSRSRLLHEIWHEAPASGVRSLESQIRRLRSRIEVDPANPRRIVSVRGLGYKLESVVVLSPPLPPSSSFVDLATIDQGSSACGVTL